MAVALPAATANITTSFTSPTQLPASEPTSIAAGGGVTFPNNGAILLRLVLGAITPTISFLFERGVLGSLIGTPLFTSGALTSSGVYLFGPFQPSVYNDTNGLVNFTLSVYTGSTAGTYFLPGAVT